MRFLYDKHRHLICVPYSIINLHVMADLLGIGRHWYHSGKYPHYDLPKKYMSRIGEYAEEITSRELLMIIKNSTK